MSLSKSITETIKQSLQQRDNAKRIVATGLNATEGALYIRHFQETRIIVYGDDPKNYPFSVGANVFSKEILGDEIIGVEPYVPQAIDLFILSRSPSASKGDKKKALEEIIELSGKIDGKTLEIIEKKADKLLVSEKKS